MKGPRVLVRKWLPRAAAAVGDMAGGDIWIGTHAGGSRQCTQVAMPASRFTCGQHQLWPASVTLRLRGLQATELHEARQLQNMTEQRVAETVSPRQGPPCP